MRKIIFIGAARDFHAVDWYRTVKKVCPENEVYLATDLIESEGHARIVTEEDSLIYLYNIDKFLFKNQSSFSDVWRNICKLLFFPMQVKCLKRLAKENSDAVFHAHTMYYMFLSWRAGIKYIGTPQGPEILIRPYTSKIYKYFTIKSLMAADRVTVDSVNLQNGIRKLCGKEVDLVQNGIDVAQIQRTVKDSGERNAISSIRGMYPLYRIYEIVEARNRTAPEQPLVLFYPFWEDGYKDKISKMLSSADTDLARILVKTDMYRLMAQTYLVISIPESDSSPRSVYESIFCGCCVAVTYNPWIENLPACMRKRVYVIELEDENWFKKAIAHAKTVSSEPFIPSEEAMDMFDQDRSMRKMADLFYNN